jgi:hypothetical protein
MSNFKAKDKSIIPEFVSALMKAYARRGASKTLKKLKNDPVIKKSLEKIAQIDRETQKSIEKRMKTDKKFKKDYEKSFDDLKDFNL